MESDGLSARECSFAEFRRKVRDAELLSSATERLLANLKFSGRLNVVLQNGKILKSGYEEGYFRSREAAIRDGE
jgi:sulfur carrier protein ThiS